MRPTRKPSSGPSLSLALIVTLLLAGAPAWADAGDAVGVLWQFDTGG
jgi:hypothetical protein